MNIWGKKKEKTFLEGLYIWSTGISLTSWGKWECEYQDWLNPVFRAVAYDTDFLTMAMKETIIFAFQNTKAQGPILWRFYTLSQI